MNKYQVYYNIQSSNLAKSVHDSEPLDHFEEIKRLIDLLLREDDSISIYTTESKMRIIIWGDKKSEYCTLEINNARDGVNYHKKFLKTEVLGLSTKRLEEYVGDSKSFGFEVESF